MMAMQMVVLFRYCLDVFCDKQIPEAPSKVGEGNV